MAGEIGRVGIVLKAVYIGEFLNSLGEIGWLSE